MIISQQQLLLVCDGRGQQQLKIMHSAFGASFQGLIYRRVKPEKRTAGSKITQLPDIL